MLDSRCEARRRASHAATLVLTLAILVGGAAAAQSGPVLTGRLDTPRGTTGTTSAYGFYLSGDTVKVVAHGSLDADGTFVVPLAASIDSALLNPVDVTGLCASGAGAVTASPAGALHTLIMFVMWLGDETGAGAVIASSDAVSGLLVDEESELRPGDYAVYHLYAQESFRVGGTCAVGAGFPLALDIAAPAGWSLVKYGHGGGGPGSIRIETIAAMPQGAQWRTFSD